MYVLKLVRRKLSVLLLSLFITILSFNFVGLIPFNYSFSSQAWFSFSLALLFFFVSLLILSSSLKAVLSKFIPSNVSTSLGLFLFWVEVISILVRPLTLTLRLCANITAGHVLIGLLASRAVREKTSISFLIICLGASFTVFELCICLIQAVVFVILLVSYFEELFC